MCNLINNHEAPILQHQIRCNLQTQNYLDSKHFLATEIKSHHVERNLKINLQYFFITHGI